MKTYRIERYYICCRFLLS